MYGGTLTCACVPTGLKKVPGDEPSAGASPPAPGRKTKGKDAALEKGADVADGVTRRNATNRAVIDALAGQLREDEAARAAAAELLASGGPLTRHVLLLAVARACSQGIGPAGTERFNFILYIQGTMGFTLYRVCKSWSA